MYMYIYIYIVNNVVSEFLVTKTAPKQEPRLGSTGSRV